jgi:hypothetical protein
MALNLGGMRAQALAGPSSLGEGPLIVDDININVGGTNVGNGIPVGPILNARAATNDNAGHAQKMFARRQEKRANRYELEGNGIYKRQNMPNQDPTHCYFYVVAVGQSFTVIYQLDLNLIGQNSNTPFNTDPFTVEPNEAVIFVESCPAGVPIPQLEVSSLQIVVSPGPTISSASVISADSSSVFSDSSAMSSGISVAPDSSAISPASSSAVAPPVSSGIAVSSGAAASSANAGPSASAVSDLASVFSVASQCSRPVVYTTTVVTSYTTVFPSVF